jgi:hypothetical protein
VVSDVIEPAELPEDMVLVIVNALAMPGFPPPMPGCERRPCVSCGRDTWAAPSSIAAESVRETKYLCRSCGAIAASELDVPVYRLPGAAADVAAPGSLVTEEGERALAAELRRGR